MTEGTSLQGLTGRLVAVEAVSGIVHAIWAIARAQLAQVDALAREAGVYLAWVDEVATRVAGEPRPAHAETLLVVMGPERAFCGGLGQQVARQIGSSSLLGLVGQRLIERVEGDPRVRERVAFQVEGASSVDDIAEVAERVASKILEHAAGRHVEVAYPVAGRAELSRSILLAGDRVPRAYPDFEAFSQPRRILEAAVAETVIGHVRVGLAEALRTEVRARAAAAEQARHAIDRQRENLAGALRVLQQEDITNELCELYSGQLAGAGVTP